MMKSALFLVVLIFVAQIGIAKVSEPASEREISPVTKSDSAHHYEASAIKGLYQYRKTADGTAGVSAVSIDLGRSTDVSPTTRMYVTFRRSSEMRNTYASYYIGDFLGVNNYQRESAGVYSFEGDMFFEQPAFKVQRVKVIFDTSKVWAEDRVRGDFDDGPLNAAISVRIIPQ